MSDQSKLVAHKSRILEVFKTFLLLGFTSFGGPVAHIGYFRKELIERKKWMTDSQFSQLFSLCQLLPGPASSQLGFTLGYFRAGWWGAIMAFVAFTLPSAILLVLFASALPFLSGDIGSSFIHGLKLVAVAVVADAVLGMFKNLCPDTSRRVIALLAMGLLTATQGIEFQILVILLGGGAGIAFCSLSPLDHQEKIPVSYGKKLGFILFGLFFVLLIVFTLLDLPFSLYSIAQTFYQAGALVFGGGHVVMPLLDNAMVASGWVSQESFMAGYGASQAIPGPMFAFSAYLGSLLPFEYNTWFLAFLALFCIFLPGFLLISAVLPLWGRLSQNAKALKAIAGVNASVVGILAGALYDPIFTSGITSLSDVLIAAIAFSMLLFKRVSVITVVLWCVGANIFIALI